MFVTGNDKTQIYNVSTGEWSEYYDLPLDGIDAEPADWLSANCLVQIDDFVYHIGEGKFYELDTINWNFTRVLETPDLLDVPGTCSPLRLRGVQGEEKGSHGQMSTR